VSELARDPLQADALGDLSPGDYCWSQDHREVAQVIAIEPLWSGRVFRLWLPSRDAVVIVEESRLSLVADSTAYSVPRVAYTAAAARIAETLERDSLVAPLEGTLIPLPHQLHALSRALSGDTVRYLLADEVGLGKTIEAGLILRELKFRGLVRRVLVVAPKGLVTQWVSEMRVHFDEDFRPVIPGDFSAWRKIAAVDETENLWRIHDQVVCSLDSVKPMDARRGWSHEQLSRFNRERFEDLVAAGWDLIIVDEAHRLAGSTEQVARYRLGEALASAAPYLLLLSATPHQGKTAPFRRLISFLDEDALPDDDSVTRDNVAPFVIRTEKRRAIDAAGNPLFKPRHTQVVPVAWREGRHEQRALYESVTDYVREGYNRAIQEKRTAYGFLMILMQRLVTSSTAAIRTALERRLEVLELPQGQLTLFPEDIGDDWVTLDGQEQMESLLVSRLQGLKSERREVELLLSAARRCEARGPDVKAEALLERIQGLQREEQDPSLKVLVFTEFVPTQAMLAAYLAERGYTVTCLNGSMGMDERRQVQQDFAEEAQVLISTDAGGEGLNLQFCHVVVNYDLPWNPMKLEQRIGRVDRIGQSHVVRALNFALEDTVELRVREVLEQKLQRILDEFGVDKLADVLDSEEGGVDFDTLYLSAVLTPEEAEARARELADQLQERVRAARQGASLLGETEELDPGPALELQGHRLPFWTERMTLSFLRSREEQGALVEADEVGHHLCWPDGTRVRRAVFTRKEAEAPGASFLSLQDPRVRSLTGGLPRFAPGQPLLSLEIPGVSDKVGGLWSLWCISLLGVERRAHRFLPLFLADDGRHLGTTARAVWDRLLEVDTRKSIPGPLLEGGRAIEAFERSREAALQQGDALFRELVTTHRTRLEAERRKRGQTFEARRRALERVGLPQVREHRLAALEQEEREWQALLASKQQASPDLSAILLLRVLRAEGPA